MCAAHFASRPDCLLSKAKIRAVGTAEEIIASKDPWCSSSWSAIWRWR